MLAKHCLLGCFTWVYCIAHTQDNLGNAVPDCHTTLDIAADDGSGGCGNLRCAKLQPNHYRQHSNIFYRPDAFCCPTRFEGIVHCIVAIQKLIQS